MELPPPPAAASDRPRRGTHLGGVSCDHGHGPWLSATLLRPAGARPRRRCVMRVRGATTAAVARGPDARGARSGGAGLMRDDGAAGGDHNSGGSCGNHGGEQGARLMRPLVSVNHLDGEEDTSQQIVGADGDLRQRRWAGGHCTDLTADCAGARRCHKIPLLLSLVCTYKQTKLFYIYDQYIDNDLGLNVKADVIPFERFKTWDELVFNVPRIADRKSDLNYNLVGNLCPPGVVFHQSNEDCRCFVSSLLDGIKQNLEMGHCFKKFKRDNIVTTKSGKAMFRRLGVVNATPNTKKLTYENVSDFITEMADGNPIPEDLQHLLDILKKPQYEPLYGIHASIEPPKQRCWLFIQFYEIVKFRVPEEARNRVLLSLPYLDNWRELVANNEVLSEVYQYKDSNYEPLPPTKPGKTEPYMETEQKLHDAGKFLDFIRNAISHRLQRVVKATYTQCNIPFIGAQATGGCVQCCYTSTVWLPP
ncbi:hypothetical protein ACP4OV_022537 [Aristida adscensionis]